jgi:predicted ester cyclase
MEMEDKGNLDVIDEILATNCVLHFPGGVDLHGPEGYKEFRAPLYTALPDLKHFIEDMIIH